MSKAWNDLKSFVTVILTIGLVLLVGYNMITGKELDEKLLLLYTNITTSVFTYYFTKRDSIAKIEDNGENEGV